MTKMVCANNNAELDAMSEQLTALENRLAAIKIVESQIADLKDQIYQAMFNNGIKKYEFPNGSTVTLVLPTEEQTKYIESFNVDLFLEENPDLENIADLYFETKEKVIPARKGYIKIKEKKENKDD